MEVYFHSSEPIFDYKNLFYQTNNCIFILYNNLEYETISTTNLSTFKKSYIENNPIFYPEKVESLVDYINSNSSSIISVLCPSSFALFLKHINIENKILFYGLDNKFLMHDFSYQKSPYSSVFLSYETPILKEKAIFNLNETFFSKIGFLCDYNKISNYKKYFNSLNTLNLFNPNKLKSLTNFNNLLWVNHYNQDVPSNTVKVLNQIRNSPSSNLNVVIIDPPDFSKENALDVLIKNNCCAYLILDGLFSTSFIETEIISCNVPILKITNGNKKLCNNNLYCCEVDIDAIKNTLEGLKKDLSTNTFNKIKKAKKYISNLLKIHESINVLTVEALCQSAGKDIDELILNNNLEFINNNKDMYQFVRNFNNW